MSYVAKTRFFAVQFVANSVGSASTNLTQLALKCLQRNNAK